ncbi:MAG: sulfotransferase family protein [Acidimicrobiales bacterium]
MAPPERLGTPKGPWVLVVGMHRSGTSAFTGALGALGLQLPQLADRLAPHANNPDHFESLALLTLDEHLLRSFGGSWDAPPEVPTEWADRDVDRHRDAAVRAARHAFPDPGPVAWKDPRACLLLPFWRQLLPQPVASLLIWRSPMAVARSLKKRNGFSLVHGIALWEHYNLAALRGLQNTDVFVTHYEALLSDRRAVCAGLAGWLDTLPQFGPWHGTWDVESAVSGLSHDLWHQKGEDDESLLLDEHHRLLEILQSLEGSHRPLEVGLLPDPSPWSVGVLDSHGDAQAVAQRRIDAMRSSTSWRLTRPLRMLRNREGEDRGRNQP